MESKYTELIAALRQLAVRDRAESGELVCDPVFAPLADAAADAIETLSRSIAAYAKANEELLAWRRNAEEWMSKVAEEKAAAYHRAPDPEPVPDPAPASLPTRESILHDAERCVCGQREQDYGTPEDNFKTIAHLWTVYRGVGFDAVDVAMMMALLKIARISGGGGSEDSFVDLAGYAACGGEIWAKAKRDSLERVEL